MVEISRLGDWTNLRESSERARALTLLNISKAIASPGETLDIVERMLGPRSSLMPLVQKSATSAISTTDVGLTGTTDPLRAAWADLVRRVSLIGRMGSAVRRVPAATQITVVDTGVVAGFVTEGAGIPCVRPILTDHSLMPGKIAVIVPHSVETLKKTGGNIASLIERDEVRAIAVGEDSALLDGAAAVTGGRPASILNGVSPLSGGTAADIEADILALMGSVRGGDFVSPFFLASPAAVRYLIGLRSSGGDRVFANLNATGGTIHGITVLVSTGAPDVLVLLDADALLVVDGDMEVDVARAAAFQFDTAPSAGAQDVISLWQTNAIGIKAQRYITWALAWSDAVAYVTLPTGSPS
jgi:HK97 family phage major capsid protein